MDSLWRLCRARRVCAGPLRHLGGKRLFVDRIVEPVVADLDRVVRADLVLPEDLADPIADGCLAIESTAADHPADRVERRGRCLEQRLALGAAPLGQLRVATGDESLARPVWMFELEDVALVKQTHLDGAGVDELADGFGAQRGQPVDPVDRTERSDLLLGDHPPVADEHELLDAEVLPQRVDLAQQGRRITRVPLEDRDRHGDAPVVGKQAVVDLELALLAVAVVPQGRERTGHAFEVARGQVVESQVTLREMAGCQLLLDVLLALEEPVHRVV